MSPLSFPNDASSPAKASSLLTDKGSSAYSDVEEEEVQFSDDESDSGHSSDCSVTSGLDGPLCHHVDNHFQDTTLRRMDSLTPSIGMMPQSIDSEDTTWTDDKHSSFLDSIEATFVRKMYDKEYCSLDVCGHSSHSSITWEQDSVESHPSFLNMRKPNEQTRLDLPPKIPPRSWVLAPSVLSSPWIQHFKSKPFSILSPETTKLDDKNQGQDLDAARSVSSQAKPLDAHCMGAYTSSHLPMQKRAVFLKIPDRKQTVAQSGGWHVGSDDAGRFKKLKCQQSLSQLDLYLEDKFNSKVDKHIIDADTDGDSVPLQQDMHLNAVGKAILQVDGKEVVGSLLGVENGQGSKVATESLSSKKSDQVVPFEEVEKDFDQSTVPEMEMEMDMEMVKVTIIKADIAKSKHIDSGVEQGLSTPPVVQGNGLVEAAVQDSAELERVTACSGSRTWTWGIEGTRHQLKGKTANTCLKFSS